MARPRTTTGTQIRTAAMRLFVEQGYDKTSLREIAEEVGVTKAALYYHFRTKEDILRAAYTDYGVAIDDLVAWLEDTPPSLVRNTELVDRLIDVIAGEAGMVLRFGQANPTVTVGGQQEVFVAQVRRLLTALAGRSPQAEDAVRATLAFGALVIATVGEVPASIPGTAGERRAAGRKVALELLDALTPTQRE